MTRSFYHNLTVIYFVPIFMVITSCAKQSNEITIVGHWQVTDIDVIMPDLSPTIIKGGEDLALSTKYEFREDNSCTEISSFYPEGIRGTWVLNTDSMILAIRNTDKEIAGNSDYHISFESETHMTWKQNFDGLGSIEMTLTKAKR